MPQAAIAFFGGPVKVAGLHVIRRQPKEYRVPAAPESATHFKAIGLIPGAHLYSHFHLLILPPLFPLLKDE